MLCNRLQLWLWWIVDWITWMHAANAAHGSNFHFRFVFQITVRDTNAPCNYVISSHCRRHLREKEIPRYRYKSNKLIDNSSQ